jgi:hypothetical protein
MKTVTKPGAPLTLLLVLCGCDKSKADTTAAPAPPPSAASAPSGAPLDLAEIFGDAGVDNRFMAQDEPQGGGEPGRTDGPAITLATPGAERRAVLAYDFALGKPQMVTVTFAASTFQTGAGAQVEEMPPLRLVLSVAALRKPAPGLTEFEVRLAKADVAPGAKNVPPEMLAEMRELSKASGVSLAKLDVSARGIIGDLQFTPDPQIEAVAGTLLPLLEQSLTLFFVPLPEEAVGVGATWTTALPPQPGGPQDPPSTSTLKAVTKTTAIVETTQVQAPERRDPDPDDPQSPPGPVMVTGKGSIVENLRFSGVASKAESSDETSMKMLGDAGNGPSIVVKRKTSLEAK